MEWPPFYRTAMGRECYEKRVPDLIAAIDRLADGVQAKRDPSVQELIDYAADLCEAADAVMNVEIVPGSPKTREAFDLLRANAAAVRRILTKIESGRK